MKILFFDTETTSLPKKRMAIQHQPHLVQFWAIFGEYNIEGQEYEIIAEQEIDVIFDPGMHIPKESSDIHWITDDIAQQHGPFDDYAKEFLRLSIEADYIVCHNVWFDMQQMFWEIERRAEKWWKRADWEKNFKDKTKCTMLASMDYCKIPGRFWKYKWPKLAELHIQLFWEDFDNAHNAFADIVATRKCFFELIKKWFLKLK